VLAGLFLLERKRLAFKYYFSLLRSFKSLIRIVQDVPSRRRGAIRRWHHFCRSISPSLDLWPLQCIFDFWKALKGASKYSLQKINTIIVIRIKFKLLSVRVKSNSNSSSSEGQVKATSVEGMEIFCMILQENRKKERRRSDKIVSKRNNNISHYR